jgi:NitT/TauT family transport system substrate-binding protein
MPGELNGETMQLATRRDLLAGFGTAAVVAAAASLGARSARAQEKLRVGVLRLASSGPVFIAFERGYFRDQGLEVEMKFFDAAQPIAVATASGDVEFGVTAFTGGLFNLAGKGALRIVAGQSREAPGYPLVAYLSGKSAFQAGLKSPKNLVGHSIGITQVGSSFHYCLGLLARKYGLDFSKMKLVPLQSLTNLASALKGGRIEAALLPATSAQPLLDAGDAELLGWVGDETPWQLGAVFAGTGTNAKHELVARFLAGYRGGTRDFHDHLLAARRDGKVVLDDRTRPFLEIVSKYTNLPAEKLTATLPYVEPDAVLELASVADQLAWMQQEKFVDAGFGVSDIVDASYGYAK